MVNSVNLFSCAGSDEPFHLRVQDYTLGTSRKIGGNAQALSKNRRAHHARFLGLRLECHAISRIPEKQPEYRSNRSHGDFLTKILLHVDRADRWWNALKVYWMITFMSYGARRTKKRSY